jgi:hypothetical protein
MLVEGFFIVKDDIPPWFIWVHYLAFHTYIFRAFMANEFEPIASFDELPGGAPAQFSSGRAVLEFYSMADVAIGRDIGIVVAFIIVIGRSCSRRYYTNYRPYKFLH